MREHGLAADLVRILFRDNKVVNILVAVAGDGVLPADLPVAERHEFTEVSKFGEIEEEKPGFARHT